MKRSASVFLLPVIFRVFSCGNIDESKPDEDDFKNLHLVVERTHPDTVDKTIRKFYKAWEIPVKATELPDGRYEAESPLDDYQYRHIISFEVEDGKFLNVDYDEIKFSGKSKTGEAKYNLKMNENVKGSAPETTYPAYEKQIEEKQNLMEIDAISGATYTKYRLQLVAALAIVQGPAWYPTDETMTVQKK